jgi:hypothetical protein
MIALPFDSLLRRTYRHVGERSPSYVEKRSRTVQAVPLHPPVPKENS